MTKPNASDNMRLIITDDSRILVTVPNLTNEQSKNLNENLKTLKDYLMKL